MKHLRDSNRPPTPPGDVLLSPRLGLLLMAMGFIGLFGAFSAAWSLGFMAGGAALIALAVLRFFLG